MVSHTLRIREVDREIFKAIRDNKKTIETRAGSPRYSKIRKGDVLRFTCGKDSFERTVVSVNHYRTITALLKKYSFRDINPSITSPRELREMYYKFPGYKERISKFGILAWELT